MQASLPSRTLRISKLRIKKLFGHYSYELATKQLHAQPESNLLILYGDNGSGKTTIANILYHMLSSQDKRGHRSFIASTRFKQFSIVFENDMVLSAFRTGDSIVGPYYIVLSIDGSKSPLIRVHVKCDEEYNVRYSDVDSGSLRKLYCELLPDRSSSPFYLTDTRLLESDTFPPRRKRDGSIRLSSPKEFALNGGDGQRTPSAVDVSVSRLEEWVRKQSISATKLSDDLVSELYIALIRGIQHSDDKVSDDLHKDDLAFTIAELTNRAKRAAALGLMSMPRTDEIISVISQTPPDRLGVMAAALRPYVDSFNARLDSLAKLEGRLRQFLEVLNSFFRRKHAVLQVPSGLAVLHESGEKLDLNVLSSGERQLLTLLCNILVATDHSGIFIIDEPEISLNVKWQRGLLRALCSLSSGSSVQFVVATHSIEIVSSYMECVAHLQEC